MRTTRYGFLFGLAPSGVYPATSVTRCAVRSYRTFSPLPHIEAVFFLRHFPWARAPQALPGTLSFGARTFLHLPLLSDYGGGQRLPGRLPPKTLSAYSA